MSGWTPWRGRRGPEPEPEVTVDLTSVGMDVLWQARADEAHRIVRDALKRYGHGPVPSDVLLDVQIALHPPKPLRPAVPVVPGPDGARRADA